MRFLYVRTRRQPTPLKDLPPWRVKPPWTIWIIESPKELERLALQLRCQGYTVFTGQKDESVLV